MCVHIKLSRIFFLVDNLKLVDGRTNQLEKNMDSPLVQLMRIKHIPFVYRRFLFSHMYECMFIVYVLYSPMDEFTDFIFVYLCLCMISMYICFCHKSYNNFFNVCCIYSAGSIHTSYTMLFVLDFQITSVMLND